MNEQLFPNAYDEETYDDYVLGGVWDDFKGAVSSVFKTAVSVVKPVSQDLVYKQVTGQERPPQTVIRQPIIIKKGLPSWALPVGLGALAILILPKLKKAIR